MARWLTPVHTLGVAVAAGLLAGMAVGRATAVPEPTRNRLNVAPETRARFTLARLARAATTGWRVAVLTDSVRRGAPSPGPATATVVIGRGVPTVVAEAVHDAVDRTWTGRPHAIDAPFTMVVAVVDSTPGDTLSDPAYTRVMQVTHALPDRDGTPCLSIVRVGAYVFRATFRPGNVAWTLGDQIPGLCGFVTAFGRPGPGVTEWIAATNGQFGTVADWSAFRATPENEPVGLSEFRWNLQSSGGLTYVGCAKGDAAACREWLDLRSWDYYSPPVPTVVRARAQRAVGATITSRVNTRRSYFYGPPFAGRFLADLVAIKGPDAFERFWTSDRDLDAAFEAAYDMSIGTWTAQWFRTIGTPVPRELRAGWGALPGSLFLIVLFVGGALAYASRRTVSA